MRQTAEKDLVLIAGQLAIFELTLCRPLEGVEVRVDPANPLHVDRNAVREDQVARRKQEEDDEACGSHQREVSQGCRSGLSAPLA